jgi:hypothetical protein
MSLAALGLLKFVPDVIDLFSSKNKTKDSVDVVSNIAKEITGKETVDEAEKALSADPSLAYQFKISVMENDTILEKLDEQSRARAGEQYKSNHVQADKLAGGIMTYNLIVVGLLAIINVVAVYFMTTHNVDNPALVAIISNLVGTIIGNLIAERQQVVSFYFGSSLGSKLKNMFKKEDT